MEVEAEEELEAKVVVEVEEGVGVEERRCELGRCSRHGEDDAVFLLQAEAAYLQAETKSLPGTGHTNYRLVWHTIYRTAHKHSSDTFATSSSCPVPAFGNNSLSRRASR